MSDLTINSLQEFQSFLEKLQGGINKKIKLNLVAIQVNKEVNGIVHAIFELRKEVEEIVSVGIKIKEKVENPTTFGIKQEVKSKLQELGIM